MDRAELQLKSHIAFSNERLAGKTLYEAVDAACEAVLAEAQPAVLREEPRESHLVRGGRTLCGLTKWEAGNVDIEFGLRKGYTTCVTCLRAIALEWKAALSSPLHQAEPAEREPCGCSQWGNCDKHSAPSGVVEREDVIERAINAQLKAQDYTRSTLEEQSIGDQQWLRKGMTEAARVILEAALGKMTDAEYELWPRMERPTNCWDELTDRQKVGVLLDHRRKRLLAHPQAYTERVTVTADEETVDCWDVRLDGKALHAFAGKEHARRYARGLRADLADASAGEERGGENAETN